MLDLIVPGAGSVVSVLQTIYTLCNDMRESQKACERVHRRLADILTELHKSQQAPSSDALARYGEMLTSYAAYLKRYQNKPLYARLLQYQKMMDELRLLNEEIDTLLALLNIATNGAVMQWKNEWKEECEGVMTMLMQIASNSESVLSEVRGMREQLEALTVIRYELQQARLHRDTLATAKTLYSELTRVSKASVEAIPTWFVPQLDLDYDPKPFARGSFGAIHRGTWRSGTNVVVKTLLLEDSSAQVAAAAKAQFFHEIELWHTLSHPNVVKMFGACHVTSPPFIVCEDAAHGNLASFFTQYGRGCMWGLLHDVALGLEYLHASRHIVHGDLKLNNLLVGSDGAGRIADFGLSFVCDESSPKARENGGLKWLAPECLTSGPTYESDVYALAMCVIESVTGEPPFAYFDDASICQQLREGNIPPRPTGLSDEAWELVVLMTAFDPAKRPKLSVVITALKKLVVTRDRTTCRVAVSQAPTKSRVAFSARTEIVDLIAALKSDDDAIKNQALKWLYRRADDEETAHSIKRADGYRWLVAAYQKPGVTWGTQAYAFGCVNRMWMSSALTDAEQHVTPYPPATPDDLAVSLKSLEHPERDDEMVIEALERIRFVDTWDAATKQAFLGPIVDLLRVGSMQQLEEATRSLRCLLLEPADVSLVVGKGVVPLLFNQLEVGSPRQQDHTAILLGFMARTHNDVADPGLIRYLVELASEKNSLQATAAWTLRLAMANRSNHVLLVEADAIQPLIELLKNPNEYLQESAVNALFRALTFEEGKRETVAAGAIPALAQLVRDGSAFARRNALMAFARLAWHSETRAHAIRDAGGIRLAAESLRRGDAAEKMNALFALHNLAHTKENQLAIAAAGVVVPLVDVLRSGNDAQKACAAETLASIGSNHESTARAIRAADVISLVVGLLQSEVQSLGKPAARALGQMAQIADTAITIVAAGAVPLLVELANTDDDKPSALAILALHQLGQSEALASLDPIDWGAVIERLRGKDAGQRRRAVDALNTLASVSESYRGEMTTAGVLMLLVELVHTGSEKEQGLATSALLRLADGCDETCRTIGDAGVIASLVALVEDGIEGLSTDAMALLDCVANLEDGYRQAVVSAGATPIFASRLLDGTTQQREQARHALQTLARGSATIRQTVIDELLVQTRCDSTMEQDRGLAALEVIAADKLACRDVATAALVPQLVQFSSQGSDTQKGYAVGALRGLVKCDETCGDAIVKAGGVSTLVQMVQTGTAEHKQNAAIVLGSLARHDNKRRLELVRLNVMSPLVEMARVGDEQQKTEAATALGSLLKSQAGQRELKKLGGMGALQTLAKNGTARQAEAAQRAIAVGRKCRIS